MVVVIETFNIPVNGFVPKKSYCNRILDLTELAANGNQNPLINRYKCFPFVGENLNLCWSPDGSTVAVGNKDDLVSFIDIRTQKSKHDEQFKFEVNEISWNNEGDLFFLTSGPGALHIYRLVIIPFTVHDAIEILDGPCARE